MLTPKRYAACRRQSHIYVHLHLHTSIPLAVTNGLNDIGELKQLQPHDLQIGKQTHRASYVPIPMCPNVRSMKPSLAKERRVQKIRRTWPSLSQIPVQICIDVSGLWGISGTVLRILSLCKRDGKTKCGIHTPRFAAQRRLKAQHLGLRRQVSFSIVLDLLKFYKPKLSQTHSGVAKFLEHRPGMACQHMTTANTRL